VKKFNNFITFEGPEGSGKSTIAKMVERYLGNNGKKVLLTREPGGTGLKFAEDIRNVIFENNDLHVMSELLLFSAARKEHLDKVIKPNTANGTIVICDRFADSSTVYQGMTLGLGKEKVEAIHKVVVGED
jgi:dTMP kinase